VINQTQINGQELIQLLLLILLQKDKIIKKVSGLFYKCYIIKLLINIHYILDLSNFNNTLSECNNEIDALCNFSEKYAAKAKDELINVVMNYVNEEFKTVAPKQIQKNKNKRFEDDDMLFDLFDSDNDSDLKKNNENNSGPCSINSIMVKLRKEKELFLSLINNDDNSKLQLKSKEFWIEFRNKLPILYNTALRLLSIPASSAFIERFFSICGTVCTKRNGNMGDDLLIKRSFLKSNLKILNELEIKQ
jgi:hypothetical protein